MNEAAFRAAVERYRRRMIWRLKAEQLLCALALSFLKLRYHLLCFAHFGWRRALIFLLKTPEHFKAVLLDLFTHGGHREAPNVMADSIDAELCVY